MLKLWRAYLHFVCLNLIKWCMWLTTVKNKFVLIIHQVPSTTINDCENYTDFTGKKFMDPKKCQVIWNYIEDNAQKTQFQLNITPSLYQLSYVNILLSEMFILLDCVRPKLNNIQFLFVLHLYGDANHLTLVDALLLMYALQL